MYKISSDAPTAIVYLIFRISDLEIANGRTRKWRIYIDPWILQEEGLLRFSAPTYTVTPYLK
jgi:hypothetical protein